MTSKWRNRFPRKRLHFCGETLASSAVLPETGYTIFLPSFLIDGKCDKGACTIGPDNSSQSPRINLISSTEEVWCREQGWQIHDNIMWLDFLQIVWI